MQKDKVHREQFTKQMASYYDQVRVCGSCYQIYLLLDWARNILGTGDAHGAGLEHQQQAQQTQGGQGGGAEKRRSKPSRSRSEAKLSAADSMATGDIGEGLDQQSSSVFSATDGASIDKVRRPNRSRGDQAVVMSSSVEVGRGSKGRSISPPGGEAAAVSPSVDVSKRGDPLPEP